MMHSTGAGVGGAPSWRGQSPDFLRSFFSAEAIALLAQQAGDTASPERAAAVACIDIAGFTSLTERFDEAGAHGAERLSAALNEALRRVIEAVDSTGGDILSFAGDAVWAAWKIDEHAESGPRGIEQAILRASLAAQKSQIAAKQPMPFDVELKLRAVVGTGGLMTMTRASSTAPSVVAGTAITDAGAVLGRAQIGKVTLSARAHELAGAACACSPLPNGLFQLLSTRNVHLPPTPEPTPIDPALERRLLQGIPRSVVLHLDEASPWLAEFRTVSALFVNLPVRLPLTSAQFSEVEEMLQTIERTLVHFDGDLYQVLTDEKGLVAIGLFGTPSFSHEDDPARATKSAVMIRSELAKYGETSSIGVATGRVFCDVCGTASRRTLTIAGPTMNLAARLMQSAAGSILCDTTTANAASTQPGLAFEPPRPLLVKGKAEAVATFRPVTVAQREDTRQYATTRPPVGRTRELGILTSALGGLLERGQRGVVVLEGEAGVGKSRLAQHFALLAERSRVRVLGANAERIDNGTPYRALVTAFEQLLELPGPFSTPAARGQAVLNALAARPELVRWAPLLNRPLGLDLPENESSRELTEQARAQKTRELLCDLFELSPEPIVVSVENAHWLDSASWVFLKDVQRTRRPSLILLTMRPSDVAGHTHLDTLDQETTTTIALGPLSPEETRELVLERLEVTAVPDGVMELITSRSRGNPLFSTELASAMRDLGLLTIAGDRCSVARETVDLGHALDIALEQRGVPATLQGIVVSRLDRMSADERLVLKIASVLGWRFPEALLVNVCAAVDATIRVDGVLSALAKRFLLHAEPGSDAPTWMFGHAVIREAVYGTLPFKERTRLHRFAAEWYERDGGANPQHDVLGYHWQRTDEPERATRHFDQAGAGALAQYANEEAAMFLATALELDESAGGEPPTAEARERWAERRLDLGAAHVAWSKYEDSRKHLERGLRLLGRWVPEGTLSACFGILVEVMRQVVFRVYTKLFFGRDSAERTALLRQARAFEGLTETYFNLGQNALCLYSALRSLNLAELAGPSPELARGYASVGAIAGFVPWISRARDYCRRAQTIATTLKDRPAEAWVAVATGVLEAGLAEWRTAESEFQKTQELAELLGDARRRDDSNENLAAVQYLRGDFEAALATAERLWDSAYRRGDLFMQADALRRRSYCLLAQNRTAAAAEVVERLGEIRRKEAKIKGRELNSDVYLLRALIHARRGELVAARQEVETGGRILGASSFMFYDVIVEHSTFAEVCLLLREAGELGPAPSRLGCRRLNAFARSFPCARPAAQLWSGVEAWHSGRHERARAAWASAATLAHDGGLAYFEAMALYQAGIHLPKNDPKRIEHLVQSARLLEPRQERYYAGKVAVELGVATRAT
jgi:predicted ATPase/class 3 adenylate cyclase